MPDHTPAGAAADRSAGEVSPATCTLMTMHGHPDDEVFHAGATLARYTDQGVRAIAVTGTRGELGKIVAPDLNTEANRADLGALRMRELRAALAHLGVTESRWLGYRDSGMAGSPRNADAEAFCACDVDEAVGRLVALIRELRPHVLLTHNEAGGDGHPDHVRAALVARLAYERAGDPAWYPEQLGGPSALEPWAPLKLYEVVDQFDRRAKLRRLVEQQGPLGAAPFVLRRLARWRPWKERQRAHAAALQGGCTTRIDVRDWLDRRHAALLEFRSQIGPDDDAIAMTPDERRRMVPTEDFCLRASRVPAAPGEDDLLAGL